MSSREFADAIDQGSFDPLVGDLGFSVRSFVRSVASLGKSQEAPVRVESAGPAAARSDVDGHGHHTVDTAGSVALRNQIFLQRGTEVRLFGMRLSVLPRNPRRSTVAFAVCLLTAALTASLSAEPDPKSASGGAKAPPALLGRQGLYLGLGLFTGTHRPEMQDRFQNDRFFAALLLGGFGSNTEWENTGATGFPWYASYHVGRWQVALENMSVSSSPTYQGVIAVTIPGATPITVNSWDETTFDSLTRSNTTLSGGFLVNPGSNVPVHVLLGMRTFGMEGTFGLTRLSRLSAGSATGQQADTALEGRLEADASGLIFGAEMLLAPADRWQLRLRARLFSGSGAWFLYSLLAKGSTSTIAGEISQENGNYRVTATELDLGVSYELTSRGRLFARFFTERMTATDSEVVLLHVSSNASENVYSTRLTEFLLTYPGSSQTDRLSGFLFGYEHNLHL